MTLVGTTLRTIRLEELIGEGGMGEVYVGVDERLQRRVAVKSVRADRRMDATAQARLLREAQILSQVEHPNICRIYDYIEGDDNDFIVLELVRGHNLSEALEQGMEQPQKLDIAIQVADALVAAHSMSVIHRDLKPENIMITSEDGVKVLDFGLARSLSGRLGDAHPADSEEAPEPAATPTQDASVDLTALGDVMGTPRYMSPEQARGEPVTAASDMYSFGLVLQELFTGSSPYGDGLDVGELVHRARWGDTLDITGVDPQVADIVNRLKSFSPKGRPSAVATVERLRWIADRPRRRMRRLAVAVVGASLVAAVVASTVGLVHARRSLAAARQAQAQTEAVNLFLQDMLTSADPSEKGRDVKVIDVLDQAAAHVEQDFADHPMNMAAVLYALGQTYSSLGEYSRARELISNAYDIRRHELGPEHPESLAVQIGLGVVLRNLGQYQDAGELIRETLEAQRRVLGADHPQTLSSLHDLGMTEMRLGHEEEAEKLLRRTLEARVRTLGNDHRSTVRTLASLATVLRRLGEYAEAEELNREVLEIHTRVYGAEHPETIAVRINLASVLMSRAAYKDAAELNRENMEISTRVYGEEHPKTLIAIGNLAVALNRQGKPAEAVTLLRHAVEVSQRVQGEEHPFTLNVLGALSNALRNLGEYGESETLSRRHLEAMQRLHGRDHPRTLSSMQGLSTVLLTQGKYAEAEPVIRETVELRTRVVGPEHPHTLAAMAILASTVFDLGRYREAEELARRTLEAQRRVLGDGHPLTVYCSNVLATALASRGEFDEAETLLRKALEDSTEALGPDHPQTMGSMASLAEVLADRGSLDEAESLYREALERRRRTLGENHPDTLALEDSISELHERQ